MEQKAIRPYRLGHGHKEMPRYGVDAVILSDKIHIHDASGASNM
ncbi:hypothetical protein [Pelagimonas varians]|nr:hypothetical protein [Pelagimonas varians]